jgi:hypothetical protein
MEFLTILLSGLLALVSPIGVVTDKIIAKNLRSRLNKVEQLQVRVDNAPSYQLVQGKVERVRIAGRGLWLTPDIRIGALEIETDPLNVDLQRLRQGGQRSPKAALRQPAQAGVRLALTETDINKALQSPAVKARLRVLGSRLLGGSPEAYEVLNPRMDFLGNNRIRFQVELRQKDAKTTALMVESGLSFTAGHSLKLTEPAVTLNGQSLSPILIAGFSEGIGKRFDLRTLEEAGITARVLQWKVDTDELQVAAFVRVDASNQSSASISGERRP